MPDNYLDDTVQRWPAQTKSLSFRDHRGWRCNIMESAPPTSAQAVLGTIMKLHALGCSPEEIATRLLSGGIDTVAFRVQGLVEIAIACAANRKLEFERVPDGETPRNQGG